MSSSQKPSRCVNGGALFKVDEIHYLKYLNNIYPTEIQYLESAYVANAAPPRSNLSPSPSEIMLRRRHKEIDRTFTGLLALYWIYHRDYDSFTRNQPRPAKLTKPSFTKLCDFFHDELDNFQNSQKLSTLITMQVTNDLGKSDQLKRRYIGSASRTEIVNHDLLMHYILKHEPELVPSINTSPQSALIRRLICLASEHNPGQLVQGESPPALLDILHDVDVTVEDLRLKYMEMFLDVSGAYGHIDHEGAFIMTETVYQSYDCARKASEDVLCGGSAESAWRNVLGERLHILEGQGWKGTTKMSMFNPQDRAKARLFCMARLTQADVADMIARVFDQTLDKSTRILLISGLNKYGTIQDLAVVPAYMPEMFGLLLKNIMAESVEVQTQALAVLLRYLARVLHLTAEERSRIEVGVVVVEREVKDTLHPLLRSESFDIHTWLALEGQIELPKPQVARRLPLG